MPALLFAVAMGLHIFATDHVLAEHFPVRLTCRWRFALAGGALTGWLVAVAVQPTGTPLINTLTAFLGGAILLNVFMTSCRRSGIPALAGSCRVWSPTRFC